MAEIQCEKYRNPGPGWGLTVALLLVMWLTPANVHAVTGHGKPGLSAASLNSVCFQAAQNIERESGVPRMLLSTIALVETGKWDRTTRANIAWPWTVNARGQSRHYRTKNAAMSAVRQLQARGFRSIDVGCMQINLHFHPDAFATLEQAFDPRANVAYAARFLKQLRRQGRSWNVAVGHYHSHNRLYYLPYRKKVQKLWRAERRRDALERRAARRRPVTGRAARPTAAY